MHESINHFVWNRSLFVWSFWIEDRHLVRCWYLCMLWHQMCVVDGWQKQVTLAFCYQRWMLSLSFDILIFFVFCICNQHCFMSWLSAFIEHKEFRGWILPDFFVPNFRNFSVKIKVIFTYFQPILESIFTNFMHFQNFSRCQSHPWELLKVKQITQFLYF